MHGVGIVQQRRMEKRETSVEQDPETGKREDYFPRTVRDLCCDSGLRERKN
jgi:hypothetical protein